MAATTDNEIHHRLLRRTLALAEEARKAGNHPFGALLATREGDVQLEAVNRVAEDQDWLAHAEILLVRAALRKFPPARLAGLTLYTSCEPCAMCAGAIGWAGVERVVFAISGERLYDLVGRDPSIPAIHIRCQDILATTNRPVEVVGPLLQDEAEPLYRSLVW